MAREVNLTNSGWVALGTNAPCPQFQMTVRADWIDDNGVSRTAGPTTITWPNVIGQLTAAEKAWLADEMADLLIRIGRKRAGIDG